MILGMANRSLVLSEPIYKPAPFLPGKHYVEAEVREMPEVLRYYRAHHSERSEIVDRAYRFVTQELRMETSSLTDSLAHRYRSARPREKGRFVKVAILGAGGTGVLRGTGVNPIAATRSICMTKMPSR